MKTLSEFLTPNCNTSYRVLVGKGDGQYFERCPMGNLEFFIEYVQGDEARERVWRIANEIASWLVILGLIEIILSGIYMWWFTISHEHRPISDAISFTLAAVVFCGILFFILQAAISPRISNDSLRWANECSGTITFYAKLSKIYYEPVPVYFVATLLELGALGVMLRQIIKALIGRNASSQSTVG